MKKLVIASNNQGKITELSALLEGIGFQIYAQSHFNTTPVEESGTTFVENAIIKARHAAAYAQCAALADDSGIEVDALNGAPGIHSARFAGEEANDQSNNALLIEKMRLLPSAQRGARYRAVIVYMRHQADPSPIICEGCWEGVIQLEPRGEHGFGYDPYFYLPELGCTSAELDPDRKNSLSHRGQALRLLIKRLAHATH